MDVFWEKVELELDRDYWYAGETLCGTVHVTNTENIKIRGIHVFLRGKGHNEWRIMRSGDWRTVKDDQAYLDSKLTVWGVDKHKEDCTERSTTAILPRGQHRWPFTFELPESYLPCSFESKLCYIRYYLRLVVDIPYASNPTTLKHFTVIGPFTDCMSPEYLTPQRYEIGRRSCLFLFCIKPRMLTVQLDRTAYCCGESIKLHCIVFNGTDRPQNVVIKLLQKVEFYITRTVLGLSKQVAHTAFEYKSETVKPKSEIILDLHKNLQIPVVPPTLQVNFCKLLQIYYILRVMLVEGDKTSSDFSIDLPITIATVPFRIPNKDSGDTSHNLEIHYKHCSENVEGGRYISAQFRQGQVYDGTAGSDGDETVLYQPLYLTVGKGGVEKHDS